MREIIEEQIKPLESSIIEPTATNRMLKNNNRSEKLKEKTMEKTLVNITSPLINLKLSTERGLQMKRLIISEGIASMSEAQFTSIWVSSMTKPLKKLSQANWILLILNPLGFLMALLSFQILKWLMFSNSEEIFPKPNKISKTMSMEVNI